MVKFFVCIYITLTLGLSFAAAQYSTIQDPDGWTYVRSEPRGDAPIIHKVYENEVFYSDGEPTVEHPQWVAVSIPQNDYALGPNWPTRITGYIHSSRILPLSEMETDIGDDFSFQYVLSPFDSLDRIIARRGSQIHHIDGRHAWGTDGGFPKVQVDSIRLFIKGKRVPVHPVFFQDLYECRNRVSAVHRKGDTYFLEEWHSDGAGAYFLVWAFDRTGVKQRLIWRP